jgi:hypothetical protein
MILMFTLSMPGCASWDGKWSGEGQLYARFRSFRKPPGFLVPGYFGYNFGDGWYANVKVKQVTAAEKAKLARRSKGFCGYDWMIDSILIDGRIITTTKREAEKVASRGAAPGGTDPARAVDLREGSDG